MYARNNKPNGWSWSLITIALLVSISSFQESAASPPMEEQDYYCLVMVKLEVLIALHGLGVKLQFSQVLFFRKIMIGQ